MNYRAILVLLVIGWMSGCADGDLQIPEMTATTFNSAGAPTVEFSVPDMMCPEGCGEKTKEILAGQPGAKDVLIDFEGKRAVVAVAPGQFDADAALAAMLDHGFDKTTLVGAGPPQRGGEEPGAEPQAAEAPVVP